MVNYLEGLKHGGSRFLKKRDALGWIFAFVISTSTVGVARTRKIPAWVKDKPAPSSQFQRSIEDRGINPCQPPDPGYGVYGDWQVLSPTMQFLLPENGGFTRAGGFDVVIHFHGREIVRKQWVQVMHGAVFVGAELGVGSAAYKSPFSEEGTFDSLLMSLEHAIAEASGRKHVHIRKLGLSSWSAGYGAVEKILEQKKSHPVDAVILLDGLHSDYVDGHADPASFPALIAYAKRAAAGERLLFISHSSIIPPGYVSTTETAHYLIWETGGKPTTITKPEQEPMGLVVAERYRKGNFIVRGYLGNGGLDHCAQVAVYRRALSKLLIPRWHSPNGKASGPLTHHEAEPGKIPPN